VLQLCRAYECMEATANREVSCVLQLCCSVPKWVAMFYGVVCYCHVTHVNESCLISECMEASHVTHVNESCLISECVEASHL